MAVLKCMFCGNRMYYHGEPEDDIPMEHYFCPLDIWNESKNLIVLDVPRIESWRCKRCGSFTFFSDYVNVSGIYAPKENFSTAPMQEPFEFGPFWNDFQWFDITESDVTAAEVFTKFPGNLWLAKNDDELRLYEDENRTKCVGQFRRFQVSDKITVATMSLNAFKKILANWDDIEFFYKNQYYNFMKESDKINVWRGQNHEKSVYSRVINDDENFVDDLINAKILDGKSIVEVQDEVIL